MSDILPKACVILGAGASFDVHGGGSVIRKGEWRPPLAKELFDFDQRPAFYEIAQEYPGVRFLGPTIDADVRERGIGLEDSLRRLAEHSSASMREAFKHVPAYLRDVVFNSARYTAVPSTYVKLVTQLLAEQPHEVLFITLNYDTLLETALELYGYSGHRYEFKSIEDYVQESRNAKIVKLHGSVSWFKELPSKAPTWEEAVLQTDLQDI